MNLSALIEKMVVLFVTMGFGYLAGKMGIIDKAMSGKLSKLVVWITSPLLNLYSVLGNPHTLTNGEVYLLTAIAIASDVFLIATSRFIPRLLGVKKEDARLRGIFEFMYIFGNVGFMGFPVISALYGSGAIFYATIFMIPFNILTFSYGAYIISGREAGKKLTVKTFLHPSVSTSVLAYLLYITNVRVPELVVSCIDSVGCITTPVAMLILGASLAVMPIKDVFTGPRLYGLAGFKLIVIPVLLYFLVGIFVKNEMLRGITVVISAMPSAVNSTILSYEYGGDTETASAGVFLTTLLSLVTIPVLLWVLFVR